MTSKEMTMILIDRLVWVMVSEVMIISSLEMISHSFIHY